MVVIGGSGSGKSVLIKQIIGTVKPDSGSVIIDGIDIAKMSKNELYGNKKKDSVCFFRWQPCLIQ